MRCLNIGIISLIWLFSISGMQNSFAQHPNKIPEIEMVEVKGGAFYMGSDDSDKYAESMEKPKHTVTLDKLDIGIRLFRLFRLFHLFHLFRLFHLFHLFRLFHLFHLFHLFRLFHLFHVKQVKQAKQAFYYLLILVRRSATAASGVGLEARHLINCEPMIAPLL